MAARVLWALFPRRASDLVDVRPFKQKMIPMLPPKSNLKKLVEQEEVTLEREEILARMIAYTRLLKIGEETKDTTPNGRS